MMRKTISELENLQAAINAEVEHYKTAIKEDKEFDEVKTIYLRIKQLEKQSDALMKRANRLHGLKRNSSILENDTGFMVQ